MEEPVDPVNESSDSACRASRVTPQQLAWGVPSPPRSYWPARIAILTALLLYLSLPNRLIPGNRYIVVALEAALLVVLSLFTRHRTTEQSSVGRLLAIVLGATVTVANFTNIGLLIRELLLGRISNGRELISSSLAVWSTNVIVFGLGYWELDRGGPMARHDPQHREPDFLFPQMSTPGAGRPNWAPGFLDYLYVSLTNALAFSPTDTMPLTPAAKALMTVQSIASLLIVVLVAARAVNILS